MKTARRKGICRHCRKSSVNRPRGLCWSCYYRPGVIALYPSTSKFARRGVGSGFRLNAPLPEPTGEPPGTEGKIVVLEGRAERGEAIFHPADARWSE